MDTVPYNIALYNIVPYNIALYKIVPYKNVRSCKIVPCNISRWTTKHKTVYLSFLYRNRDHFGQLTTMHG